jgi:hypothetical protein
MYFSRPFQWYHSNADPVRLFSNILFIAQYMQERLFPYQLKISVMPNVAHIVIKDERRRKE